MDEFDVVRATADHRGRIYRYLLSMARDRDVAEDLTQETLLRATRAADSLREPAAQVSWLYRVATNAFLDWVRTEQRRPVGYRDSGSESDADAIGDPGTRVDRMAEQALMGACVREYLNQLPDIYRAAVLLHDGYGLTDREVAGSLRIPLATAKMRIHRGRARLRAALSGGCQFETDERGVLVCDPIAARPDCGPDCMWCVPGARANTGSDPQFPR
jgi:RNA polymerase sigma-70 factor (ECF subfamily)